MRRVIQLWKQKFGRNSLDGKGMRVKVITHNNYFTNDDGTIMKDNAAWNSGREVIVACDRENEAYSHSMAAALDVMAHESTHAVLHYGIGDEFSINGDTVADAINEAYADIFACIMTEDESWKMGEDVFDENSSFNCIRDIANPTSTRAKSAFPREEWNALKGALDRSENIYEEHRFSHYISHAAYLMKKSGLSWEELRNLWYQTIHKNVYTPTPKFSDVRREVLRAAEAIPSLRAKKQIIEDAFDAVGIYEPVILSGKVLDAVTHKPIAEVYIAATTPSVTFISIADEYDTDSNGNFSLRLGKTKYNIEGGYSLGESEESIEFTFPIDLSRDRVITILLSRDGTVSLDNLPDMPTPTSPDIPVPVVSGDIPIDEAHFPDARFRYYVTRFDADGNNVLSKSEREKVTIIDFESYTTNNKIASLEGIKYFSNLEILQCSYNQLTTLDLAGCYALIELNCVGNPLITLNLGGCSALKELHCPNSQLTTLNLSGCSALEWVSCENNQLTTLNVSGCTTLELLHCENNQLTTLDLKGCPNLESLYCNDNQLTILDLEGCNALGYIVHCENNQLTTLDLSGRANLAHLYCENNQLTRLDVSGCTTMRELYCENNKLTTLNVSGCNNLWILYCHNNKLTSLNLSDCPKLAMKDWGFSHDNGIRIIWPSSISTASAPTVSPSGSYNADSASEVLAVLPAFTPAQSGTYTFTVSLDREPPEGSPLLLISDSEDLNASFALTDEADTVRLSADFTAGRTYAPVIVANTEQQEQSGGCNSGILGMVLLVVLLRKRRC